MKKQVEQFIIEKPKLISALVMQATITHIIYFKLSS